MGRWGRFAVTGFVVVLPIAVVFIACGGSDSSDGLFGSSGGFADGATSGDCGPSGCPGDGGTTTSDSDTSQNDGAPGKNKPKSGSYMGLCITLSDGGYACDPGLTCRLYGRTVTEAGATKTCDERICTHKCNLGCPAPSTGCAESGYCDPVKCTP
jgi:hypothetical protein